MKIKVAQGKIITAIEITSDWLKIGISQNYLEGGKVLGIFSKKISGLKDEEVSASIAEYLKSHIGKVRSAIRKGMVCLSLPRESASVRFLRLPSQSEAELKAIVEFQVTRQVPYSREDIVWDYEIIETDQEGYSKAMLVVVHQDILRRHINILAGAGIEPQRVRLSSWAISDAYLSLQACLPARQGTRDEIHALVDIDTASCTLVILKGQHILATRGMPLVAFEGEDAQIWRKKLIDEINRTVLAYQSEEGHLQKPQSMVVLGAASLATPELASALVDSFGIEVKCEDLLEKIKFSAAAQAEKTALPKECSFSSILGLMSERSSAGMNLLLPELQKKRARQSKEKELLVLIGTSLLILILGAFLAARQISYKRQMLTALSARISEYNDQAEELQKMQEKLRVIKERESARDTTTTLLKELFRVIPEGVSLNMFVYTQGKPAVLKGSARSIAEVFKLVSILEESPYFMSAKSRSASMRKVGTAELADFEIDADLEKNKK